MYKLSVQTFQIRYSITIHSIPIIQDLWVVQIIAFLEFDTRIVKAKIDLLISTSKLEILFNTNISLAGTASSLETKYLRYTLLDATRSLENVAFCVESKNMDNKM